MGERQSEGMGPWRQNLGTHPGPSGAKLTQRVHRDLGGGGAELLGTAGAWEGVTLGGGGAGLQAGRPCLLHLLGTEWGGGNCTTPLPGGPCELPLNDSPAQMVVKGLWEGIPAEI